MNDFLTLGNSNATTGMVRLIIKWFKSPRRKSRRGLTNSAIGLKVKTFQKSSKYKQKKEELLLTMATSARSKRNETRKS